jgi:hypothetical protein
MGAEGRESAVEARPPRRLAHIFPPALVPMLRKRTGDGPECCAKVADELLAELLTIVFFASFEMEEGEHYPIRVVFVGHSPHEWVAPGESPGAAGPIYRWSSMRFDTPRPCSMRELVKLAVVTAGDRMYTKVRIADDGRLEITGLSREGFNYEGDPFLEVLATRPGTLSIRRGHERLLDYERGAILTGGEDVVLAAGPVRRALETFARDEGLRGEAVADYLDVIRAVVREMAAHGRGGILVVGPEERLGVDALAGYRTQPDIAITSVLRQLHGYGPRHRGPGFRAAVSLGEVLRGAFLNEAERAVEELGALTATDGAAVLDRGLGLLGFGLVLPVSSPDDVMEAISPEADVLKPFDLGVRGTRHRAAATYAKMHPGCVVFVASQDGEIACIFREPDWEHAVAWRFGSRE